MTSHKKNGAPTTAIAEQPVTSPAITDPAPDYVLAGHGEGLEEVRAEDLLLPRLKLMQPLSPEVAAGAAKVGDLVNSLTGTTYGPGLTFVPIRYWKPRIMWRDRNDGGGIRCQSNDGRVKLPGGEGADSCDTCSFAAWSGGAPPDCTAYHTFASLLEIPGELVAIPFAKSNAKAGAQVLSFARYAGKNLALYAKRYMLATREVKGDKGRYFVLDAQPCGWTPAYTYNRCIDLFAGFAGKSVTAHIEQPLDDAGPPDAAPMY